MNRVNLAEVEATVPDDNIQPRLHQCTRFSGHPDLDFISIGPNRSDLVKMLIMLLVGIAGLFLIGVHYPSLTWLSCVGFTMVTATNLYMAGLISSHTTESGGS